MALKDLQTRGSHLVLAYSYFLPTMQLLCFLLEFYKTHVESPKSGYHILYLV